ncbi:hypothetical protein Tco_0184937 [Tanacetum coccineum]
MARCAQNARNRAKSTVICRQGNRSLAALRDRQIMVIVGKGKQRGYIPGVGRLLVGRGKDVLDVPEPRCNHTSDIDELKRNNKQLKKQMDMIMKVVRSDDKMSKLLT